MSGSEWEYARGAEKGHFSNHRNLNGFLTSCSAYIHLNRFPWVKEKWGKMMTMIWLNIMYDNDIMCDWMSVMTTNGMLFVSHVIFLWSCSSYLYFYTKIIVTVRYDVITCHRHDKTPLFHLKSHLLSFWPLRPVCHATSNWKSHLLLNWSPWCEMMLILN